MYRIDQFDSLLKQAVAIARTPVTDPDKWHCSNPWKPGLPDDPKPAPYQPTGFAHFDAFVRAIPVSLHYGANGPRTPLRDRAVILAACNAGEDCHWTPLGADDVWVCLPNASDFNSPVEYAASLSHELIHWAEAHDPHVVVTDTMAGLAMHGRLRSGGVEESVAAKLSGSEGPVHDKDADAQVCDPVYVSAEMTAELGAMLLLAATGCDPNPEERGAYMQGYMGAVPPMFQKVVMDLACQRAKDAVHHLLAVAQGEMP